MSGLVSTEMGDHLETGKPPRYVTSLTGKLSLLSLVGQEMSTGQSTVMFCGWGVMAGMVHYTCG